MAWMKYTDRTQSPGYAHVLAIPDDSVAINPRGSISFPAKLVRPEMKTHFSQIEYDDQTRRLRLTLVRQADQAYAFRNDEGRFRLEPVGAMNLWKLRPSERIICPAQWEGDCLIIQLPGRQTVLPGGQQDRVTAEAKPQTLRQIDRPVRKQPATKATKTPSGRPYCICAVCGGRYPLVEHRSGSYPYGHRVGGKVCPGVGRSPLAPDGHYGEE